MVYRQPRHTFPSALFDRVRAGLGFSLAGSLSLLPLLLPGLPAIAQEPTNPCPTQNLTPITLPKSVDGLVQAVNWVGEVATGTESYLVGMLPQLMAYFNPAPWPELHDRSKQAKVPILMYHDILIQKQVFFDVTPGEFEDHLEAIRTNGLTPISMAQLVAHLRTGVPLPAKPVLLSFDDGYRGHYTFVYPLLKKYGYPAVFAIYTNKIDKQLGRSSMTWEQVKEMAADPLVTIAAHSLSHPPDLRALPNAQLKQEIFASKVILEQNLGIPIRYFVYPAGFYDERVAKLVTEAGYEAALTMDDLNEGFAGQSESLLAIKRFGQSRTMELLPQAWGGPKLPGIRRGGFDFSTPIQMTNTKVDNISFSFISGGQPMTIHARSRYQVPEIIAGTKAEAAVDGAFFSLEYLDSNVMIGPVLSQVNNQFLPGNRSENPRLNGRPLVLIGPQAVRFVPFKAKVHDSLEAIQLEMPDVTDAFVGAAFLVRDGEPQPAKSFGTLFDFDAERHRAFWGINQQGQPVIGVSHDPVGSVQLGQILAKAGFRDAVMLDSGASTSLAYKGQSLVGYEPRPVPHVVALVPPGVLANTNGCAVALKR
ncbi:polysaccharide deacetylase [Leptolyngbya sp. 'hensonii']|uniref:polysaccharide deacetylase family protein n=1 Tax=Leptolyngbya sp. 'hensonii' TaxID=1922337 RepID=UPI00094FA170|nr:polysaccharide deacetylase family protein [Leptolyngbya sp. 'hensonii']OLP17593.1 polysaccharide deacetylase [Leptolyngbya sp. 'hensonii']